MRKLCEDYTANKECIEELSARLNEYEEIKRESDPKDWPIIEAYITEDSTRRTYLLKQVFFFESALARIGGRTADVLRQIYVENVLWSAVEDRTGIRLQPSTIARERRKGLEKMCGMYAWAEEAGAEAGEGTKVEGTKVEGTSG